MTMPALIEVSWRLPAEIEVRAPLARALLEATLHRRWARLRRKIARTLFHLVHQRLGLRAPALLRVANGTRFEVDCGNTGFLDYAARSRRAEGVEPEISGLLISLAAKLRVVYDIGANWGYYPLLLGTEPRFRGHVHAFEIGPRTVRDLRRVVAGAGLSGRVTVHGFGLSERDGEARLSREKHSYLSRIVGGDYRGAAERVRVCRLDRLDLPPPDLIKLDVEGHEAAVLRGAAGTLARHQPLIVIESWHDPMDRERMLAPLRLLAGLGYRIYRPIWRPLTGAAAEPGRLHGVIELAPLLVADRPAIAAALNLLAVPAAGAAELCTQG